MRLFGDHSLAVAPSIAKFKHEAAAFKLALSTRSPQAPLHVALVTAHKVLISTATDLAEDGPSASAVLPTDPAPEFRHVTWDSTGRFLAVAMSYGQVLVFNQSADLLWTLHGEEELAWQQLDLAPDLSNSLAGISFIDGKGAELPLIVTLTYTGSLDLYQLHTTSSEDDSTISHVASVQLETTLVHVGALIVVQSKNLIVVGGEGQNGPLALFRYAHDGERIIPFEVESAQGDASSATVHKLAVSPDGSRYQGDGNQNILITSFQVSGFDNQRRSALLVAAVIAT